MGLLVKISRFGVPYQPPKFVGVFLEHLVKIPLSLVWALCNFLLMGLQSAFVHGTRRLKFSLTKTIGKSMVKINHSSRIKSKIISSIDKIDRTP